MIICSTKFKISKEFLVQEYIKNKKAIVTIAKILGCSYPIIRKNLIRYDIKIRTYSEAVKNSYKKSPKLKIKVRGSLCGSYKEGFYSKYSPKQNKCIDCGKIVSPNAKRCYSCNNKIRIFTKETRRKMSLTLGGTGIPYERMEYPELFYSIRKVIRERDNYICQICGKRGNHVHHIDYNKQNCKEGNLITLCRACHLKTNRNRKIWINYFNSVL